MPLFGQNFENFENPHVHHPTLDDGARSKRKSAKTEPCLHEVTISREIHAHLFFISELLEAHTVQNYGLHYNDPESHPHRCESGGGSPSTPAAVLG